MKRRVGIKEKFFYYGGYHVYNVLQQGQSIFFAELF